MYECFYAVLQQVLLQLFPVWGGDGKDVIYMVAVLVGCRQCDQWVTDAADVLGGNLPALGVVGIKVLQFDMECCSLNLVEAAVHACGNHSAQVQGRDKKECEYRVQVFCNAIEQISFLAECLL